MSKIPTQEELRSNASRALKGIQETYDWVSKDYVSRYIGSILDLRKFVQDIVNISIAIVGIVIPILLSSELGVSKNLLAISALLFSLEIIFGIFLRFSILKKETKDWPKVMEGVQAKYEQSTNDLEEIIENPNPTLYKEKAALIKERYSSLENSKKEAGVNKFLDLDSLFFGLFILSFSLFVISLSPIIFCE